MSDQPETLDPQPEEVVDALPVLAEVHAVAPVSPANPVSPTVLPAVQAAAVAATGFLAGAATIMLVRRHDARKLARAQPYLSRQPHAPGQAYLPRPARDAPGVHASRTYLVNVRLIAG